ncbi:MAG: hypothetical protein WBK26_07020 [Burkholderiaceae bacterium]
MNGFALPLDGCTYLGGHGFPFDSGEEVTAHFGANGVSLCGEQRSARFSYFEIEEVAISGPGTVTMGGGFFGGGFGVVGAIEGIAIAGILNKLTSRTSIHTFISLITNFGEVHLHYAGMEPGALRIALSYVFHHLRQCTHDWARSRSVLIEQARATGRFSAAEVQAMSERLSTQPEWPDAATEMEIRRQEQEVRTRLTRSGLAPQGTCPNCDRLISIYEDECPHCKAFFGAGSAWKIKPLEAG